MRLYGSRSELQIQTNEEYDGAVQKIKKYYENHHANRCVRVGINSEHQFWLKHTAFAHD